MFFFKTKSMEMETYNAPPPYRDSLFKQSGPKQFQLQFFKILNQMFHFKSFAKIIVLCKVILNLTIKRIRIRLIKYLINSLFIYFLNKLSL